MKKAYTLVAATLLIAFGTAASAQNIALVNGKPIPKERFEFMMGKIVAQEKAPLTPERETQIRAELRDKMINQEILAQEAKRRGVEALPEYKMEMEFAKQSIMVNAMIMDFVKKNKPTEAEARAEYERAVAAMMPTGKEFHTRHILVDTEAQAKSLIAQIKKGAKFEALAKKHSKDPGSGKEGGDLGWVDPVTAGFVPEFTEALKGLSKGQMTQTPVQSQFGYHIIKLDDIRDPQVQKPPPFEQVEPQISQKLLSDKLQAAQKALHEKAVIK